MPARRRTCVIGKGCSFNGTASVFPGRRISPRRFAGEKNRGIARAPPGKTAAPAANERFLSRFLRVRRRFFFLVITSLVSRNQTLDPAKASPFSELWVA